MSPENGDHPHLRLPKPSDQEPFRAKRGRGSARQLPDRNREQHAKKLLSELASALAGPQTAMPSEASYVEVAVAADNPEALKSLETNGAILASVRLPAGPDQLAHATLIVPKAKADSWLRHKIQAYAHQTTKKNHRPKNEPLIANIESLKAASPREIFSGEPREFPADDEASIWWQAWLRRPELEAFRTGAEQLGVRLSGDPQEFPDEVVVLANATAAQLQVLMAETGAILELRPPEIPVLLLLPPADQHTMARTMAGNVVPTVDANVAVCLLDTGVHRAHPLLQPALAATDLHKCHPAWSLDDLFTAGNGKGHGTKMAGLAAYGDLQPLLAAAHIPLEHRLESVKILPDTGGNEEHLWGAMTKDAVARPEIAQPARRRVYCLAITAKEVADGSATEWSAAIDNLCFNDGESTRLVLISAGNTGPPAPGYPDSNYLAAIESPAQAWNALTVGANTEKLDLGTDPGYQGWQSVAPTGALAPMSRTSMRWIDRSPVAPVKPDIVMEGGNWASSGQIVDCPDELQLLTTGAGTAQPLFRVFGDTSAATALAARVAALVWARYPEYWPETIRGLLVHAALWTPAMDSGGATTQRERERILRCVGYGVPDLQRAAASRHNDVTLIAEQTIQPFQEGGTTGGLVFYKLPWPAPNLQAIADMQVEVRVTLSYFIQPKPGRRGGRGKYQYPSHQLRFELKRSTETESQFRFRINRLAQPPERKSPPAEEPWLYGSKRDRGSLHSDIWSGMAGDLAKRDQLAVFPAGGWWKEDKDVEVRAKQARYSLIVSVRVPSLLISKVDLYSEIRTIIETQTAVPITA